MRVAVRKTLGFGAGIRIPNLAVKKDLLEDTLEDWGQRDHL